MKSSILPRLAITAGEPAGIGPDICLMMAQEKFDAQLVIIADPELLADRAEQLDLRVHFTQFNPDFTTPTIPGELLIHPVALNSPCKAGQADPANSHYVIKTLKIAVQGCLSGLFNGMITTPVNKQIINEAGVSFRGHTEFLAEQTGEKVVMMLVTEGLRVALATTHLPLSQVPDAITRSSLTEVLQILNNDLQNKFSISAPQILVSALNPHAGEGGYLGMEEIEIISPVIRALNSQGMHLVGPLPADTLFCPDNIKKCDAVLAMYHDQGLPVLKYKSFGNAVNITLGLPIIRTSVDHGTAFNLAGSGKANNGSLIAATNIAIKMITTKQIRNAGKL
ncbi:MAG: 4-hydroxythreonine-4-phosphate dehydrogenase PdxA [Candidatus Endonucleobacter bathymodioli]|uniref:4-hydroxythreonine-4-phosphate dehydrogenase n=1 Tax=Candidatus Endonucleibacter bathymodioli TaxID=539814 RepID=A0AA90NSL3_9GAMM|nr:4-hydroxythreonine-4-phosphate dehydrogenase PdxA [Candidatus Endonucleobacter bathymodioli]